MGEDFRTFLRWLQSLHAPFGRFSPLVASALFAAARFIPFSLFRFLAYVASSALVLLIAADIASEMLEAGSDDSGSSPNRVPFTAFQFVLTVIQGAIYTAFIFFALGPLTPIFFIVPVFAVACLAAWRNVRLWYRQGAEFEDRLREAEAGESVRLSGKNNDENKNDPQHSVPEAEAVTAYAGTRSGHQGPAG